MIIGWSTANVSGDMPETKAIGPFERNKAAGDLFVRIQAASQETDMAIAQGPNDPDEKPEAADEEEEMEEAQEDAAHEREEEGGYQ